MTHHLWETFFYGQAIVYSVVRVWQWWLRLTGRAKEAEDLAHGIMKRWCQMVFRRLDCQVRVEGEEHFPSGQGFVVMANHQSRYDILLLSGFLERPLGFVAKRELFRVPGVSFWMRQVHSISLDRKDIAGGAETLRRVGRELKSEKRGIIIFPEGTRSRDPDGTIQAFRQGSIRLAADHQLPVLPVSLDGTRFLDRSQAFSRTPPEQRIIRLKIAPPRLVESNGARDRKVFMDDLRKTIVSNWEAIRVEWPVA